MSVTFSFLHGCLSHFLNCANTRLFYKKNFYKKNKPQKFKNLKEMLRKFPALNSWAAIFKKWWLVKTQKLSSMVIKKWFSYTHTHTHTHTHARTHARTHTECSTKSRKASHMFYVDDWVFYIHLYTKQLLVQIDTTKNLLKAIIYVKVSVIIVILQLI